MPDVFRVIEADAQLCVVTSRGELAGPCEAGPCGVMGLDAKIIIVLLLGQSKQVAAQLSCPVRISSAQINEPQTRCDLEELAVSAEVLAQLFGTGICFLRFCCRPTPGQ